MTREIAFSKGIKMAPGREVMMIMGMWPTQVA